jgi:phosphoribosyl 1,2-cyclic phosphodiesterase
MKVRFWGVRGSIPSPGPKTLKYGGNTTCIEIRTDDNDLIILDGGTGIFPLAQTVLEEMPITAHIFISHTHWDHIHGLPFFVPMFVPGNRIRIHGAYDPVTGNGIEQVMTEQMQYSFFPVREAEIKSRLEYITLVAGEPTRAGSAIVTPLLLNHPVTDFGYRIDCNGKSVFFTGDHEPYFNIYEHGEEGHVEYQRMVEEKEQAIADFLHGVDLLIMDASYTLEEYPTKRGWGHGTFDTCIQLARQVEAKTLICTHHEPTRSDNELEDEFAKVMARHPRIEGGPEIRLAYEGLEIEW